MLGATKHCEKLEEFYHLTYRQTSNIMRTKSQILNVSRLVLHLYLSSQLKPGVKSRIELDVVEAAPTILLAVL